MLNFYFEQQAIYENKYGTNTVVFLMKGSFYEIYATKDSGKAIKVAKILNLVLTRANKKIPEVSISNPYMTGIPVCALKKYLKVLIDHLYTVVLIDQDPNNVSNRTVSKIYSPSTYIDDESIVSNSKYACSIYCDNYAFGISFLDISTGNSFIHEITSTIFSHRLEELYRIVELYSPSEIIFIHHDCDSQHVSKIQEVLQNNSRLCHFIDNNSTFLAIDYQNNVLQTVFSCNTVLSPIEHLNLELLSYGRTSFIYLLNFCNEHDPTSISKISEPSINFDSNNLVLHNNAIYQLGIITQSSFEKSLFDIINKTSTSIGSRLLRMQLLNPSCNSSYIVSMLDSVEKMKPVVSVYENHLKHVGDLEKLHRKARLSKIHPSEISILYESYKHIHELSILEKHNFSLSVLDLITFFDNSFNISLCTSNLSDISSSIFKSLPDSLSSLTVDLSKYNAKITSICSQINKNFTKGASVKVEKYTISTTPTRGKQLKNILPSSFRFQFDKARCIISSDEIDTSFHHILRAETQIKPIVVQHFYSICSLFVSSFDSLLNEMHSFVAHIDTIKSRALCALDYNYSRPIIDSESDSGHVQISQLRHAIIEQLSNNSLYVPNDVSLNSSDCGMLLYGVNGAGKSSYSKSVGIAIVLAQSGHYVPAAEMRIGVFNKLYTRIADLDNIYKGQSSFFVEMSELKSIIHYADSRSIVLGDEVCKGTEDVSALAIVASSLKWLTDKNSKFIFATHLHHLPELSIVKNNDKLLIKHLAVECNSSNDVITFSREMKDGIGDRLYGLEISNVILQDDDFTKLCSMCRNEVLKTNKRIVSTKRSRYNNGVFVNKCQIDGCNIRTDLDTHHIVFQKNAQHLGTNVHNSANLVVLCKQHHTDVHSGKLDIIGWKSTTKGKVLEYSDLKQ